MSKIINVDDAYDMVMDAVVTQALPPSQKISESILNEKFSISRSVGRNLIERLTAQQFLVSVSPRVTQVAPLTLLDISQNFKLRKVLLPEVISLAGSKIDHQRIDKLNSIIQSLLPISGDSSALHLLKTNRDMNLAFCTPAGYPLMANWVRQLEDTAMRIYWLYIKTKNDFPFSKEQQGILLDVIKADEPVKIKTVVHKMICQTEERVMNAILNNKQFHNQDLLV
jgi:DNA-binding GntR family transcriptional regulator